MDSKFDEKIEKELKKAKKLGWKLPRPNAAGKYERPDGSFSTQSPQLYMDYEWTWNDLEDELRSSTDKKELLSQLQQRLSRNNSSRGSYGVGMAINNMIRKLKSGALHESATSFTRFLSEQNRQINKGLASRCSTLTESADPEVFDGFFAAYKKFSGEAVAEKNRAVLQRLFDSANHVEVDYQVVRLYYGESLWVSVPVEKRSPVIVILGKYSDISLAKLAKIDFKRLAAAVERARDAWNDAWKVAGL